MTIQKWQSYVADDPIELETLRRVQADAIRDAVAESKWGFGRFIEAARLLRYADEVEKGKD